MSLTKPLNIQYHARSMCDLCDCVIKFGVTVSISAICLTNGLHRTAVEESK